MFQAGRRSQEWRVSFMRTLRAVAQGNRHEPEQRNWHEFAFIYQTRGLGILSIHIAKSVFFPRDRKSVV